MALFEGFERRIKQVNSVLKKYNIGSLEDAKRFVMIRELMFIIL